MNNIVLPESVTSIGQQAFSSCGRLTNIVIPDGVTSIGYGAFSNCERLTSIICLSVNPPSVGIYSYLFDIKVITAIYVPAASVNAYKTASGWSYYADKIQAKPE